jgi:hypothetical protein
MVPWTSRLQVQVAPRLGGSVTVQDPSHGVTPAHCPHGSLRLAGAALAHSPNQKQDRLTEIGGLTVARPVFARTNV